MYEKRSNTCMRNVSQSPVSKPSTGYNIYSYRWNQKSEWYTYKNEHPEINISSNPLLTVNSKTFHYIYDDSITHKLLIDRGTGISILKQNRVNNCT